MVATAPKCWSSSTSSRTKVWPTSSGCPRTRAAASSLSLSSTASKPPPRLPRPRQRARLDRPAGLVQFPRSLHYPTLSCKRRERIPPGQSVDRGVVHPSRGEDGQELLGQIREGAW